MKIHPAVAPVILGLAAAALVVGCGGTKGSVSSAAAPIVSSTFDQSQLTSLENELTTAFQDQLKARPGHPITDAKAAVKQVFPNGDTDKILAFAAQHFTPAVATTKGPGSARDVWAQKVVAYAVTSGGVTPSASSSPEPLGTTSTADIPGVPTKSPSPAASS